MTDEQRTGRIARVLRSYRRVEGRRFLFDERWWGSGTLALTVCLGQWGVLALALGGALRWWSNGSASPAFWVCSWPPWSVILCLGLFWSLEGLLLEHAHHRSRGATPGGRWSRFGRALLFGLPVWGLLFFRDRLRAERLRPEGRSTPGRIRAGRQGSANSFWLDRLHNLVWGLTFARTLLWIWLAAHLDLERHETPVHGAAYSGGLLGVIALGASMTWLYRREAEPRLGSGGRLLLRILPWLWFVPWIGGLAGFVPNFLERRERGARTLVGRLHDRPGRPRERVVQHQARRFLHEGWQDATALGRWRRPGNRRSVDVSLAERDVRLWFLCRIEATLLLPEGLFLGSVVRQWGGRSLGSWLDWFVASDWLTVMLATGALVGVSLAVFELARQGPRPAPVVGRHHVGLYGGYVLVPFLGGLATGVLLVSGQPAEAWSTFLSTLALLSVLDGGLLIFGAWFSETGPSLRFLLVPSWIGLAALVAIHAVGSLPAVARHFPGLSPTEMVLLVALLVGVGAGGVLWMGRRSHLLRPSFGAGWQRFLEVTLVLPGGGLAVPFWIDAELRSRRAGSASQGTQ